jgi:hypothetical protein
VIEGGVFELESLYKTTDLLFKIVRMENCENGAKKDGGANFRG